MIVWECLRVLRPAPPKKAIVLKVGKKADVLIGGPEVRERQGEHKELLAPAFSHLLPLLLRTSSCSYFPSTWAQVTRFSHISRCENICNLEILSLVSTLGRLFFGGGARE